MIAIPNPFPKGTVVTESIAGLPDYRGVTFDIARKQIDVYKENFSPRTVDRGHAMGIRGRFGSGKTHLAFQLSDYFVADTVRPSKVIYAKLDRVSFVDLYRDHFARRFKDEDLNLLVAMHIESVLRSKRDPVPGSSGNASLTAIAHDAVAGSAKENPEHVVGLLRHDLLPIAGLSHELDTDIEATTDSKGLARDFARAYARLKDPSHSRLAGRWIRGDMLTADERADIGLDTPAIEHAGHAKEAMKFLLDAHRKAGVPILMCLDECERFAVRGTPEDRAAAPGLLKDLAEMFEKANHFLIVCGADAMWNAMPADFFDRIHRKDIVEALLDEAGSHEATKLLAAYCEAVDGSVHRLFDTRSNALRTLIETSENNARRLLHIAHEAFELKADAPQIRASDVVTAADRALSAPDRLKKLEETIESVANRRNLGVSRFYKRHDSVFDYALGQASAPVVLVQITQAVHRQDEVARSRAAASSVQAIRRELPDARTCTVIVGYTTPEVRAELGTVVDSLMIYDEDRFERQFEDFVKSAETPLIAKREVVQDEEYQRLQRRFDRLETERQTELERLTRAVSELQAQIARGTDQERRARVTDKISVIFEELRSKLKDEQALALDPRPNSSWRDDFNRGLTLLADQLELSERLQVLNVPLTQSARFNELAKRYRELLEVGDSRWRDLAHDAPSAVHDRWAVMRQYYLQRAAVLTALEIEHERRFARFPWPSPMTGLGIALALAAALATTGLYAIWTDQAAAMETAQTVLGKVQGFAFRLEADPPSDAEALGVAGRTARELAVDLETATSALRRTGGAGGSFTPAVTAVRTELSNVIDWSESQYRQPRSPSRDLASASDEALATLSGSALFVSTVRAAPGHPLVQMALLIAAVAAIAVASVIWRARLPERIK